MSSIFKFEYVIESLPPILSRLHITLYLVAASIIGGMLLGAVLAAIRMKRIPVLNQAAIVYISFVRGTPIIVQMFIVYYGLPILLMGVGVNVNRWDKLFFVLLAYGLNEGAFMGEIIRSALQSIPKGQLEAAYSIGLTNAQAYGRIIIPQAFHNAIPVLGTRIISSFQSTSLAFTLGIIDMIGQVQAIGTRTQRVLEGYVAVAVIFIIISLLLEKVFAQINRKAAKRKAVGV